MRLNQNGPRHEYTVEGQRSLLWQPVWMNVTLQGDTEMTAAEQLAHAQAMAEEIAAKVEEDEPLFEVSDI